MNFFGISIKLYLTFYDLAESFTPGAKRSPIQLPGNIYLIKQDGKISGFKTERIQIILNNLGAPDRIASAKIAEIQPQPPPPVPSSNIERKHSGRRVGWGIFFLSVIRTLG